MTREYFDQGTSHPPRALEVDSFGNLVIIFPFDQEYLTRVRQIPGRWWNPPTTGDKFWRAPLTKHTVQKALELFPTFRVSSRLAEYMPTVTPPLAHVLATGPQPDWISVDLFPFQRAGVHALLRSNQCLLADDMGLGKTFQGIAWASRHLQGKRPSEGPPISSQGVRCTVCGKPTLTPRTPRTLIHNTCANRTHQRLAIRPTGQPYGVLVICPATVKYNWEAAIHRARPQDKVAVIDAKTQKVIPERRSVEWVVINYDLLDRHLEALHAFNASTIVLDESHYIKSAKALRTQLATVLCHTTERRLLMTGTPILNRPYELWPQLVALGLVQEGDFFKWAKQYCDAKQVRIGWHRVIWDFSGASHLDELWRTLQAFTVRRLKQDVLPELPDILYSEVRTELDREHAIAYANEVANFEEWLVQLDRQGRSPAPGEALTHLGKLRQLAVAGKVPRLLERLGDFVESQTKAVIFCTYLQAGLFQLRAKLPPTWKYVSITGEQSALERKTAVDTFQNDPTVLFALCSTMAAGVGIDLFAADTVIFLDEPWVPGVRSQAIARIHRIGQTAHKVHVIDLIGKDTIDETVLKVLQRKQEVVDQVVDGIAPTEAAVAADVARQMFAQRKRK